MFIAGTKVKREILTGPECSRRYSSAEKVANVQESLRIERDGKPNGVPKQLVARTDVRSSGAGDAASFVPTTGAGQPAVPA